VLRVLSDELRDHNIIVETDLEADLPMVEADHVHIQQTLINLVHNAAEAMHGVTDRAKALSVRSQRHGDELLIQVRDRGVGIKDLTVIFDPFFTTKESGWGWALLSVARSSKRMAAGSGPPPTRRRHDIQCYASSASLTAASSSSR